MFPGSLKRHKLRELCHLRDTNLPLKDTNLSFGSVLTSVIPSRPRWNRTGNPFVWLLQQRKRWSLTNYFLYGIFDHGWYEFQLKYWCLSLLFFLQNSRAWSCFEGSLMPPVTIKKSERKKSFLIQFHVFLVIEIVLDLLKWLKATSFYEKRKILL